MELIDIEKNKFNRFRKRYQKLIKNLSNLEENEIKNDEKLLKNIRILNDNMEHLIYLLDVIDSNINDTDNLELKKEQEILIENDENASKIINKFLPAMFMYQLHLENNL
jgi:hypothetical protein